MQEWIVLVYGGGARFIHSGDGSGSIVGTGALIGGICILGAAIASLFVGRRSKINMCCGGWGGRPLEDGHEQRPF